MANLINTISTALSNTVLFAAAIVVAGFGFAVMGTLALFALLVVGVAMIAAPFVALQQPADTDVKA